MWAAANGVFGAFVRVALLTGQRRQKVIGMKWDDISADGEWSIPVAKREKSTAGSLMLPQTAIDIIHAQPRFASNPYVFAGVGTNPIGGMSKRKRRFDKQAGLSGWTIHDLRRTARSLMSRAGVRPDIAERSWATPSRVLKGFMTGTATARRRPTCCVPWPPSLRASQIPRAARWSR